MTPRMTLAALCTALLALAGGAQAQQHVTVLGLGQQTVKSVAPTAAAIDLRLEMNVETR